MLEASAGSVPITESDDAVVFPAKAATSPASEADERALAERARHDSRAFAELYRRYVNRVYAFAYRRSGSTQVAEDVTSTTFERALRSMSTFEWRSGGFGAWLFRIAANELANHYRRQGRTSSDKAQRAFRMYVSDAVIGGEFDRVETMGSADLIREAMTTLNDRYQQVITLRLLSGLSHDDAAKAMGLSKPVMAVTLHRAVAALRKAIEERGGRDGDQV
ncbi:MAG TPA: RNA polymerase sigma factor [Acidimicrobiales bacterium]|nr:RNA polymerase sigma factor [Acidimicrobiales bacterium]